MKKTFLIFFLLPLVCFAAGRGKKTESQPAPAAPRNVIFVVGDGMGTAQVYASIAAQRGNSMFLRFPCTGFSCTYSNNKYTTDSGAGGSALMTGHKVDNYHIALAPDGSFVPSFLTKAKAAGMGAGFVVSSTVLDATPASAYAHVPYRKMFDTISLQMVQSGFDVMIGGGKKYFEQPNRNDGLSLLDSLQARGYQMAYSTVALARLHGGRICGLLSEGDPAQAPARGHMLALGTLKALESLSMSDNGFALMVEGSQIDWANHNNDSAYLAAELADFEEVLRALVEYVEQDGHTLLVVTADHESGGLTLPGGSIEQGVNKMQFSTGGHTGVMVPVFAMGPGAERFAGIHQNTDFFDIICNLLSL